MTYDERGERLHKILARAGIGSKRTCETYITQGRVSVDGGVVSELGVRVDPERQEIRFDGELVKVAPPVYYLVYKPKGVVCTSKDQFGRRCIVDLLPPQRVPRRLFPVGRLEEDSEGLIIVTDDGHLAHKLADHRTPVRHTYFVRVRGRISREAVERLRTGVWLSDGRTSPMDVKVQRLGKKVSTLLVSPAVYQHRLLRRTFAKVGANVDKVVRVRIGPLTTHDLKKGSARRLRREDVEALLRDPGGAGPPVTKPRGAGRRRSPGARGPERRGTPRSGGASRGRRTIGP